MVTRARVRRQVCVAWSPNNIDGRYYDIKVRLQAAVAVIMHEVLGL